MSEPHRITSPPPPLPPRPPTSFLVEDDEGIVHVGRTYTRPVYTGFGSAMDEEIDITDCDLEVESRWREGERLGAVTCLECLGVCVS